MDEYLFSVFIHYYRENLVMYSTLKNLAIGAIIGLSLAPAAHAIPSGNLMQPAPLMIADSSSADSAYSPKIEEYVEQFHHFMMMKAMGEEMMKSADPETQKMGEAMVKHSVDELSKLAKVMRSLFLENPDK